MPPVIQLPRDAKRKQLAQGLVVQGYCMSVLAQEPLKLDSLGSVRNANEIKSIAAKLDQVLGAAKDHARSYLNDVQPKLIAETVELRASRRPRRRPAGAVTAQRGCPSRSSRSSARALASQPQLR